MTCSGVMKTSVHLFRLLLSASYHSLTLLLGSPDALTAPPLNALQQGYQHPNIQPKRVFGSLMEREVSVCPEGCCEEFYPIKVSLRMMLNPYMFIHCGPVRITALDKHLKSKSAD